MNDVPHEPVDRETRSVEVRVLRDSRSPAWLLVLPLIPLLSVLWVISIICNPPPIYIPLPTSDEQLCSEGRDAHCVELAAEMDDERALPLLRTSCERGYADACHAGALRSSSRADALTLARSACDGNHSEGCVNWATLELASCAELGSCNDARVAVERSCEFALESKPCRLAPLMLRFGYGVARDHARAIELFTRQCKGGDQNACAWADKSAVDAELCEAGEGLACYAIGLAAGRKTEDGLEAFDLACQQGVLVGCEARQLDTMPALPLASMERWSTVGGRKTTVP